MLVVVAAVVENGARRRGRLCRRFEEEEMVVFGESDGDRPNARARCRVCHSSSSSRTVIPRTFQSSSPPVRRRLAACDIQHLIGCLSRLYRRPRHFSDSLPEQVSTLLQSLPSIAHALPAMLPPRCHSLGARCGLCHRPPSQARSNGCPGAGAHWHDLCLYYGILCDFRGRLWTRCTTRKMAHPKPTAHHDIESLGPRDASVTIASFPQSHCTVNILERSRVVC